MIGIKENITGVEELDAQQKAVLARAIGYPHAAPEGSFLLHVSTETAPEEVLSLAAQDYSVTPSACVADIGGKEVALYDLAVKTPNGVETKQNLFPVLAYGSNRAPQSLNKSFGHTSRQGPLRDSNSVILTECTLPDYTVVWAACISATGSIPATLQREEGVESRVSIMWADTEQLMRTNLRERNNYALERLLDTNVRLDNGTVIPNPLAYLCHFGVLDFGDGPAAVQLVKSTTRFDKIPQAMVQAYAKAFLGNE